MVVPKYQILIISHTWRNEAFSSGQSKHGAFRPTRSLADNQRDARVLAKAMMSRPKKTCMLPNGLTVTYVSREDVNFLYKEIFNDKSYLRHGLEINEGDIVMDIGANIGLFSIFASGIVKSKGRVIAVEPIPEIYNALSWNLKSFKRHCIGEGLSCTYVDSVNEGASDGQAKKAKFHFYPRAAGWSSNNPKPSEVHLSMARFLSNSLQQRMKLATSLLGCMLESILSILPRSLLNLASRRQTVECRLCTVSDLIRRFNLPRIDFLKIDVERGEMEVLNGIQDQDWPKIRHLALEVHDLDGRLNKIKHMLSRCGFSKTHTENTALLGGTGLKNLYARR